MAEQKYRKHLELLRDLVMTPGVSGWEDPVREKIRSMVSAYGETEVDAMGNLILTLGTGEKHVVLVAHMDEIGLVVSHIEDNGYVRFKKVGGLDDRVLVGRTVDIYLDGRPEPVPGVIGLKPPHLMKDRAKEMSEVVKVEDMVIDLGTRSRPETESLGVKKLCPVLLRKHFSVLANDIVATRGLDDRLGCAALVEVLETVESKGLDHRLTFAWSVQEELGLRGAYALGNRLRPDYAVAIDSCTTGDSPKVDYHLSAVRVGDGPVLRMFDRVAFASRTLMRHITDEAAAEEIPLQIAVTGGTTDGAALQTFGTAMIPLGVPIRYVHSPTEMMSLKDFDNLVRLVSLVAKRITSW
jgi:putative aminopeptidase FrvX